MTQPSKDPKTDNTRPTLLELVYLTYAANTGEISSAEWHRRAVDWARQVIQSNEQSNRADRKQKRRQP